MLWTASLISNIGSWMQTVAVGALVISRTGQASWAVLVAAGAFLPIGLLSPVGGALADRLPRRPVIAAGNLAAGLIAAVIAVLVAEGHAGPYVLLALVTLQGSASALIGPFSQAILPDLVPRSEFLAASSLNSAQWNAGRIVGPALAGATVAAFGFAASFTANAVSFLAVVIALLFVRLAPPPGGHDGLLSSMREGLRAAMGPAVVPRRHDRDRHGGVPRRAVHRAGAGRRAQPHARGGASSVAAATAALTTAQGAGAVVGALVLPPLAVRIGRGPTLAWSLVLLPVALLGYGGARSLWLAVAALFWRRPCLHGCPVGPADRRAAARARRLPGPGAQLLPGRARRRLPARGPGPGPGRRPHRRGLDDGRRCGDARRDLRACRLAVARVRQRVWSHRRGGRCPVPPVRRWRMRPPPRQAREFSLPGRAEC